MDGKYPGHKVQIDIKYVPNECIRFPSYGNTYYQITAIDEYSRKRVLDIVKEKSTFEMAKFMKVLERRMGFPIHVVQVDNGKEFVHDEDRTKKRTSFEKMEEELGMEIRRTRPYSPWQNGKVERSHREDGKILYGRKAFTSEKELRRQVEKHARRYNSTAKTSLSFKSSNEIEDMKTDPETRHRFYDMFRKKTPSVNQYFQACAKAAKKRLKRYRFTFL